MINDLILYGKTENIKKYISFNFNNMDELKWNGNCFGVHPYAYYTDTTISTEDLKILNHKFQLVGGNSQHVKNQEEVGEVIHTWASNVLYKHKDFITSTGIIKDFHASITKENIKHAVLNWCCQRAARHVPEFKENQAVLYLIDVDRISLSDLPDLNSIGEILQQDFYTRRDTGFRTTGGDGSNPSPINSSNILFANRDRSILIAHWHLFQQLFNYISIEVALKHVSFSYSHYVPVYSDLYTIVGDFLGIEIRDIHE